MKQVTAVILLLFITSVSSAQTTYTFNGNGNWSNSNNWVGNRLPPDVLHEGDSIIIAPQVNGSCILDTSQIIAKGASFMVEQGKNIILRSELVLSDSMHNSYLNIVDDTTHYYTGLDTTSYVVLQNMPKVENLDTADIPNLERPAQLPPAYFIDVPSGGDQGSRNGCLGWALGYTTLSSLSKRAEHNSSFYGYDKVFSPDFIWHQINGGLNIGGSYGDALALIKNQGCCKFADMPEDFNSISSQPFPTAFQNAGNYKIADFAEFSNVDIDEIKFWLSRNYPIPVALNIDDGFMNQSRVNYIQRGGRYVWANKNWTLPNWLHPEHALVICGYDDLIHAFYVKNSWGTRWGYQGFGWIDYDLFKDVVIKHGILSDPSLPEIYLIFNKRINAVVTTSSWTDLTSTSVTVKGTVSTQVGTTVLETGVCFSVNIDPTTASTLQSTVSVNAPATNGTFSANLTDLQSNTRYYSRAYARTDKGILYGDNVQFVTNVQDSSTDSTFTDPRDGEVYPIKTIGSQVWMTKNLNYAASGSWCYDNNLANCAVYGRLYDWKTALNVAPPGWHLPSDAEWTTLTTYLGGESVAGGKMKATTLWPNTNTGDNSSGFAGLPGGLRDIYPQFYNIGHDGYWWSSTEFDTFNAWSRVLGYINADAYRGNYDKLSGYSVRCVRD